MPAPWAEAIPNPEAWDRIARWADLRERDRLVELLPGVQPVVVVAALEEAPYRRSGMQFGATGAQVAVAGQRSCIWLLNTGRCNLVVDWLTVDAGNGGTATLVDVGHSVNAVPAARGLLEGSLESRIPNPGVPLETRLGTVAAAGITPIFGTYHVTSNTGAFAARECRGPWTVAPGRHIAVEARTANLLLQVTFVGRFWEDAERMGAAR